MVCAGGSGGAAAAVRTMLFVSLTDGPLIEKRTCGEVSDMLVCFFMTVKHGSRIAPILLRSAARGKKVERPDNLGLVLLRGRRPKQLNLTLKQTAGST